MISHCFIIFNSRNLLCVICERIIIVMYDLVKIWQNNKLVSAQHIYHVITII